MTSLIIQRQNSLTNCPNFTWMEAVSGLNDVKKSFSVFYNKLNKPLNKHVPFKPSTKKIWDEVKSLLTWKNKAHKDINSLKCPEAI